MRYRKHLRDVRVAANDDAILASQNCGKAMWKLINTRLLRTANLRPHGTANEMNYYFIDSISKLLHNASMTTPDAIISMNLPELGA